jgi:hypothetical protein
LSDSVTACDPSAQECFVGVSSTSYDTFRYAKQGAPSQTSPQDYSPAVNLPSGLYPAATGGFLYMGGVYGVNPSQTYAVLQRVSEDGISGVSTLANLGLSGQYYVDGPLAITSTRVYAVGSNIGANIAGLISVSLPNGVGNSSPPFLAGTTMSGDSWLAAWGDDTAIYFATSAHQWVTCPASGCSGTPRTLADASAARPYLVGDAQAIYWINTETDLASGTTTGFSLMKMAR